MLFIPDEYRQNLFVNPKNFEHKVRFFVFGSLSDAEKEFMKTHLQVTSYGNLTATDATHPERKLFFLDIPNGFEVIVAFTIDPDTNYEISFDDVSGLGGIVMPRGFEADKPLFSFSTMKTGDQGSGEGGPSAIRNMQVFADGKQAYAITKIPEKVVPLAVRQIGQIQGEISENNISHDSNSYAFNIFTATVPVRLTISDPDTANYYSISAFHYKFDVGRDIVNLHPRHGP